MGEMSQMDLHFKMNKFGVDVVTCYDCETVFLIDVEKKDPEQLKCPHCEAEGNREDFYDVIYST